MFTFGAGSTPSDTGRPAVAARPKVDTATTTTSHPSDATFFSRNTFLGGGAAMYGVCYYFYKQRWTRPFQAAVILTTPLLGVAVMQTVRLNWEPEHSQKAVEKADAEVERKEKARDGLRELAAGRS